MIRILRLAFFTLFVWPVILIFMGLNVRHRERLKLKGPAILVANHNSHLDVAVMMSLFPIKTFQKIKPVAAADYFLRSPRLAWFSKNIVGIIPIARKKEDRKHGVDPLADIQKSLDDGHIIIYFPEGSRGNPEEMTELKKGIAHLSAHNPDVPILPIFMHGLGKALPKDESFFVPFIVDVVVGEAFTYLGSKDACMQHLNQTFAELKSELPIKEWA